MITIKDGLIHFLNDPEILTKIKELANILTSPKDIADILQVDDVVFLNLLRKKGSEVYNAFYGGFLMREVETKKANILPVDVDTSEFTTKQLLDFKSILTIQLHG